MTRSLALLALLASAVPAAAQHAGGHAAPAANPYAGQDARPIKALSAQQEADLRAGRGMGQSLAAELNGHPGPPHVLELAGPMGLSPEQRARAAELTLAMRAEVLPLGERVILAEAALDRRFREASPAPDAMEADTLAVALAQGRLRAAHQRYHLAMRAALSAEQVATYARLRGYAGAPEGGGAGTPAGAHRHGTPG